MLDHRRVADATRNTRLSQNRTAHTDGPCFWFPPYSAGGRRYPVEVVAARKALIEADPSVARRYSQSVSSADQDPLLVHLRRSIRELEDALAGFPEDGDGIHDGLTS